MEEVGMWGLLLCCCSVWLIAAWCVKACWSGWWGGCSTRPFNPTQSCWHIYAFPHPQNILSWTSNLKRYGSQYFSPSTPLSWPSAPHTNTRKDEPCLKKKFKINKKFGAALSSMFVSDTTSALWYEWRKFIGGGKRAPNASAAGWRSRSQPKQSESLGADGWSCSFVFFLQS